MPQHSNPIITFKGGWDKIASGVHTTNLSPNLGAVKSFFITPDGTRIFLVVGTDVIVRDYSIAHDVETIGSIIFTFPIVDDIDPHGISFSQNGFFMIIVGRNTNTLYEYFVPVSFDLNSIITSSISMSLTIFGDETECQFSITGDIVFVVEIDRIIEYPLPNNFDISSNIINTPHFFQSISGFTFSPEGNRIYTIENSAEKIDYFEVLTPWDLSTKVFRKEFNYSLMDFEGIQIRSNGDEIVILDVSSSNVIKFHFDVSWEIETISHFTNIQPIPTGDPRAISWKPDGTKYFIADFDDDSIAEYTVVTKWNQTDSVLGSSFPINTIQNRVTGMWWKPDGTRCYIIGLTQDRIDQLDVSTPWEVSTMSNPGISFPVPGLTFPTGLFFRPDGLKFYVANFSALDIIVEFDMSIPWDITTAVDSGNVLDVTADSLVVQDLFFKNDGTRLYTVSQDMNLVVRFNLSIPWNVSSGVFADSLDVSGEETTARGLFIRQNDSKKIYITGLNAKNVISYDI